MSYPSPTSEQIASFAEHGWLVVEDAIPAADLDRLEAECDQVLSDKERLAADWAWETGEDKDVRSFKIVQAFLGWVRPDVAGFAHRRWLTEFGSALMGRKLEFWYDQFLGKPPAKSSPTYWHQDEGYWGRNLFDKGITCWIPLHDVDARNGCMHFIDRGHLDGVLTHRLVEGVQSDLLTCDVDEARTVVCPIMRGSVTFHHSKTPHMTNANTSRRWRRAISNHMQVDGTGGERDQYPWRVHVNQRTGERIEIGKILAEANDE
jgi:phytanoyl-CoA hydroxylase